MGKAEELSKYRVIRDGACGVEYAFASLESSDEALLVKQVHLEEGQSLRRPFQGSQVCILHHIIWNYTQKLYTTYEDVSLVPDQWGLANDEWRTMLTRVPDRVMDKVALF